MSDKSTNQIVDTLLCKESEITNKFHGTITELLRKGYDSDRGKSLVLSLIDSVRYTLDELETKVKMN